MKALPVTAHAVKNHQCTCELRGDTPRVCSHVAAQETKAGEPLFTDLACLVKAAELCGFEKVDTNVYRWFDRHMGDYPVPKGMSVADMGKNALFIFKLNKENWAKAKQTHGSEPYDVGIVEDPNNPGCYIPVYDFFCGGYGVDALMGEPVYKDGKLALLLPKLKQTYDMLCDSAAAGESLDKLDFFTRKQIYDQREELMHSHPELFQAAPELAQPTTDENTWVSIARTANRVGV